MTAEDCAVVYRQTYTRKVDDGKEGTAKIESIVQFSEPVLIIREQICYRS